MGTKQYWGVGGYFGEDAETRFGTNRVAVDMKGNGESLKKGFLETFLRICGQFLRNFGESGSLLEEED